MHNIQSEANDFKIHCCLHGPKQETGRWSSDGMPATPNTFVAWCELTGKFSGTSGSVSTTTSYFWPLPLCALRTSSPSCFSSSGAGTAVRWIGVELNSPWSVQPFIAFSVATLTVLDLQWQFCVGGGGGGGGWGCGRGVLLGFSTTEPCLTLAPQWLLMAKGQKWK